MVTAHPGQQSVGGLCLFLDGLDCFLLLQIVGAGVLQTGPMLTQASQAVGIELRTKGRHRRIGRNGEKKYCLLVSIWITPAGPRGCWG
jgi:hypothetical protein